MKATKRASKADLIRDYWGLVTKSYHIGFHDRGKSNPYGRYFENPEDYNAKVNTNSILPLFPKANDKDAGVEEQLDPNGDHVFLDNYICKFVENHFL